MLKKRKFLYIFSFLFLVLTTGCVYDNYLESVSNGATKIEICNYLGNTENIHPKVLFFAKGWNGWKFWMAYTPYPKGDIDAENPCIAVSNDGIIWTTPNGLKNPLNPRPKNGYNSDTHLVYNEIDNCLELWWRPFDSTTDTDCVSRIISYDGITWTEPQVVIPYNKFQELVLSPTVWIENGVYHLVYSNGKILKITSNPSPENPDGWTPPITLPIEWGELRAWHQDLLINENGEKELVVCAFPPGRNNNSADLYYVKLSRDLKSATPPVMILHRGSDKSDFDYRSIYRSSLLKVGCVYYLYYSAISYNKTRGMALLKAFSPTEFSR